MVLTTKLSKLVNQFPGIEGLDSRSPKTLDGWSRSVGGEVERFEARQVLFPVINLRSQPLVRQPLALPDGKVGILNCERRQGGWLVVEKGLIQSVEFSEEHTQRPAIGCDVMNGHQENVLVWCQTQHGKANHRTGGEGERLMSFPNRKGLNLGFLIRW